MKVEIGDATLYLGDCREVLPSLSGVNAVVTDPPYGIGFDYETHDDDPAAYEGLMRLAVQLAEAACAEHAGLFWWQGMKRASDWHKWFPPGYRVLASCKDFVQMHPTRVQYAFDPVVFWFKGSPAKVKSKGSRAENAKEKRWDWHIARSSVAMNSPKTAGIHPCQRPIDAVEQVALCASDDGATVLDPFMGSGTTGVACANLGRVFVGIEIDKKYFDVACERIEAAHSQQRLFA